MSLRLLMIFTTLFAFLGCAPKSGARKAVKGAYGKSVAIVVGIDEYKRLPDRQTSVTDAIAIADTLKAQGFAVTTLLDAEATKDELERVLFTEIKRRGKKEDRVLIYFSGRTLTDDKGIAYLMPHEGESVENGISLARLNQTYGLMKPKHLLLLTDACFNRMNMPVTSYEAALRRTNYDLVSGVKNRRIAMMNAGEANCPHIIVSPDDAPPRTLFNFHLLEGLSGAADLNDDGFVADLELYRYTRREVREDAKQEPMWGAVGEGIFVLENPKRQTKAELKMDYESVRINSGSFLMGSVRSANKALHRSDEKRHVVHVTQDYLMGRHEVTQALWEELGFKNISPAKGPRMPVHKVSWLDAVLFANALSKRDKLQECYSFDIPESAGNSDENGTVPVAADVRWANGVACNGWRLPTEAEWEYAARAGYGNNFVTEEGGVNLPANTKNSPDCLDARLTNGERLSDYAWYCIETKGSRAKTNDVGMKKSNPWGLHDMQGNVSEWVWDWYQPFTSGEQTDPIGPESATRACPVNREGRVRRGGSWMNNARSLRLAFRNCHQPDGRRPLTGFRLVRTLPLSK